MAKAFLLRTQTQLIFDTIRLEFREPGFTKDTERLYMGGLTENLHIPNEAFVSTMIDEKLLTHGPKMGTTAQLATQHVPGTLAYNTETGSLYLQVGQNPVPIAMKRDIPSRTQVEITIEAIHIDAGDGSVLLTEFDRGVFMIFIDGILCSTSSTAAKRYIYDAQTRQVRVIGCVEGSILSYF